MRECFDRHGCDKGSRHGYERVYEPIFSQVRDEPIRLLEIGIFRGQSLAAWVDYFPNAEIVGMDIFKRVKPEDIPILRHDRVKWVKHDSREPIDLGKFDFIIDDGLHTHVAQRQTFKNFIDSAKTYFVEDVWALNYMTPDERDHGWLKNDGYSAVDYYWFQYDLESYKTEFFDLRKGKQPDSFIIKVDHP